MLVISDERLPVASDVLISADAHLAESISAGCLTFTRRTDFLRISLKQKFTRHLSSAEKVTHFYRRSYRSKSVQAASIFCTAPSRHLCTRTVIAVDRRRSFYSNIYRHHSLQMPCSVSCPSLNHSLCLLPKTTSLVVSITSASA